MLQRRDSNENVLSHEDIFSGNSKAVISLVKWAIKYTGWAWNAIIFSYDKTPMELLSYVSNISNIILNGNGEIGTIVREKNYKIGEYRLIASKEHSFNAVVCCFDGDDKYNHNNSNDCAVYAATYHVASDINKISLEGSIITTAFFAMPEGNYVDISFNSLPIAQQVYDSEPWTSDIGAGTTSATPSQWFLSSQTKKPAPKSSGGCYVATAVYGSYDCPEVWTLRRFRDLYLSKSWYGRLFIRLYYATSPTLVKCFGETGWFQHFWKNRLDKWVAFLKNKGYSDRPYRD